MRRSADPLEGSNPQSTIILESASISGAEPERYFDISQPVTPAMTLDISRIASNEDHPQLSTPPPQNENSRTMPTLPGEYPKG